MSSHNQNGNSNVLVWTQGSGGRQNPIIEFNRLSNTLPGLLGASLMITRSGNVYLNNTNIRVNNINVNAYYGDHSTHIRISNIGHRSNAAITYNSDELNDTEETHHRTESNRSDDNDIVTYSAGRFTPSPIVNERYSSRQAFFHHPILSDVENDGVCHGLNESNINRLPAKIYIMSYSKVSNKLSNKRLKLTKECSICLFEFEYNDKLLVLPCFHDFHDDCIRPWLKESNTCPECRFKIDF